MTAREYLEQPKLLQEEIFKDQDNIASMRSIVEQCTTHLSFTAGRNPSKNKGAFEDVMLDITEAEAKLEEKIHRYEALMIKVTMLIGKLDDPDLRKLLRLRYLEEKPWDEVASSVGVSESHIYLLHRKALTEFEKFIVDNSQ